MTPFLIQLTHYNFISSSGRAQIVPKKTRKVCPPRLKCAMKKGFAAAWKHSATSQFLLLIGFFSFPNPPPPTKQKKRFTQPYVIH